MNLTRPAVESKVFQIVSEQMGLKPSEIMAETRFLEDLHCDSLDAIELVMEFEDVFHIVIPDGEYDNIKTVGEAAKYVEGKTFGGAA